MSQERMHPEDLRAILAATYHAAAPEGITPSIGIDLADSMLAELARTAKPEATSEWPKEALDRIEAWTSSCEFHIDRAEKAEASVKELEKKLASFKEAGAKACESIIEEERERIIGLISGESLYGVYALFTPFAPKLSAHGIRAILEAKR